ncbi:hypothetical protein, partial [Coleofasciculus sp. H7-2]|uniref:hypothetical protein n=1 Tax=Coleofasciculus sp. H7-2 TaxID=3351545 RepID=UPI00366BE690
GTNGSYKNNQVPLVPMEDSPKEMAEQGTNGSYKNNQVPLVPMAPPKEISDQGTNGSYKNNQVPLVRVTAPPKDIAELECINSAASEAEIQNALSMLESSLEFSILEPCDEKKQEMVLAAFASFGNFPQKLKRAIWARIPTEKQMQLRQLAAVG